MGCGLLHGGHKLFDCLRNTESLAKAVRPGYTVADGMNTMSPVTLSRLRTTEKKEQGGGAGGAP